MKKAIFPGSFDPFHQGHEFIVKQALQEFDFLYIIISWNEDKPKRKYSFEEVYDFLTGKYQNNPKIKIMINQNLLTTQLAQSLNCFNLVRGYRNQEDLDYENNLKKLYILNEPKIKIFYYHNPELANISSKKIKG